MRAYYSLHLFAQTLSYHLPPTSLQNLLSDGSVLQGDGPLLVSSKLTLDTRFAAWLVSTPAQAAEQ
jgi:hypothetical protein